MSKAQWTALIDLVLVIGTAILVKELMMSVAWKYAGPISLLMAVLVATALNRVRGRSWRDFGLVRLGGWKSRLLLLPQAVGTFAVLVAISFAYKTLIDPVFPIAPSAEDRFGDIAGSPAYLALWLAIAIIHGGFFEEMIYRGFAISQLERVLGESHAWAFPVAIVLQAGFFGLRHVYYQGVGGGLATGLMGLGFGLLFWAFRRNLWPLIMAHATVGIIRMTVRYVDSIAEEL